MIYNAVLAACGTNDRGFEHQTPTNACRYMDQKGSAAMQTSNSQQCWARGESEDHTSEKVCKRSTLALKPRADITRSNRGTSGPTKRTYGLQKILKKKDMTINKPCWNNCWFLKLLYIIKYTRSATSLRISDIILLQKMPFTIQ